MGQIAVIKEESALVDDNAAPTYATIAGSDSYLGLHYVGFGAVQHIDRFAMAMLKS